MHKHLVSAAAICAVLVSSPTSAAVLLKSFNLSSLLATSAQSSDTHLSFFKTGLYKIPALSSRLGTLNSLTIFIDISKASGLSIKSLAPSAGDQELQFFSLTGFGDLHGNAFGYYGSISSNLTYPTFATSVSYTIPESYSFSASFDSGSKGFNAILADGVLVTTDARITLDSGETGSIRSRGTGVLSVLYDYSLPSPMARAAVTSAVPEPSSWAMMIAGTAIVGTTLRRRRRTSVLPA